MGLSETKSAKAITDIKLRQDEQENTLSRHQTQIRALQFALHGIVARYEFDKLVGLNKEREFWCYYSDNLPNEIKRLRAMDFIRNQNGARLTDIIRDYKGKDSQFDLKKYFYITNLGKEYLKLRSEMMQDILDEDESAANKDSVP